MKLSIHACGRALVILSIAGAAAALVSSCGETEYNVGDVGPSSTSTGGRSRGGTGNAGGTGSGETPIRGGTSGMIGVSAGSAGKASAGGGTAGESWRESGGGSSSAGESQGGATSGAAGGGGGSSPGGSSAVGGTGDLGGASSTGGAAGSSGTMATAGIGPCGLTSNPRLDPTKRTLLLRDAGAAKLALVDIGNPANGWIVPLARDGRDMQLVGGCRVMVGTDLGYEEYDLQTGAKLAEQVGFAGTYAAQRLRNRNTILVGIGTQSEPYQGGVGIVLVEVDTAGAVVRTVVYPGTFVRLVRPTPDGTFLIANNTRVFEGDAAGAILSPTFNVTTSGTTQVWKGLRVATAVAGVSETVVSTGYGANLTIFKSDGTPRRTIGGGSAAIPGGATAVNPTFFSDFQLLSSGNYLVVNSLGAGPGNFTKGIPILEYNPVSALAWYWGDPAYADELSSIQAAILLDGLDPTRLHVEDTNGQQVPVD